MIFFNTARIQSVLIKSIDLEDDFFKLSKNNTDELKGSISKSGVLEPPVLLYRNSKYIIISGHNRLRVLNELQSGSVDSVVLEDLTHYSFLEYVLLKNFRNEIGPMGKLNAIFILKNFFALSDEKLCEAACDLHIPDDFYLKDELFEYIHSLPDVIRDYIDLKDIGFKVIKNLFQLSSEGMEILAKWIKETNMRVNIFKSIVDLTVDIFKRDKTLKYLMDIDTGSIQDRRSKEEYIFNEVFKIRYPEYSALKERFEKISERFKKNGIDIDFPRYFEGDRLVLSMSINKRGGIEQFNNKLSKIDTDELRELIDLL